MWITTDDLGSALEPHVLAEVGLSVLRDRGVDAVVDGLDERADRASALMRQAAEFVKKWPLSRVLLTTRSPGLVAEELLVAAPVLTRQEAAALMARVAGRRIPDVGPQLQTAVLRPLFALLVAQRIAAVEGATGIPEVIDLVVDDVVSRENYNLFSDLRALAVETIRAGGAIDPATIAAADVAALIRSPLVTTVGRKCAFALATFEQWFAAQAILDGIVGMTEVLATMDTFDRWRYVLAIIAATGDPARADAMLAALASLESRCSFMGCRRDAVGWAEPGIARCWAGRLGSVRTACSDCDAGLARRPGPGCRLLWALPRFRCGV